MTDATVTAEKLLQIKAVKLSPEAPLTWASGWKSPIYCDNRKILSFPFVRDYIKSELCNVVFEKFADADLLGIPYRVVVSAKTLAAKQYEIKQRRANESTMMSEADLMKKLTAFAEA